MIKRIEMTVDTCKDNDKILNAMDEVFGAEQVESIAIIDKKEKKNGK